MIDNFDKIEKNVYTKNKNHSIDI